MVLVAALALPAPPAVARPTVASPAHASPAVPSPAPAPLATPVLSLRRVPELLADAVGTPKLATALDATLSDTRYGGAADACLVVQAGPVPVYLHNPALPLLPASNLKLLTATAALDKLPANDQFVTTVKGDAPPVGGTVTGNLYLIGGGDPLLRTPGYVASLHYPELIYDNLDTLADQVRAAGVTRVTGSVVGDESRYDNQRTVPSWPSRYLQTGEVGPLSAMAVNDGFAAFVPATIPSAQPAQQAAAAASPPSSRPGVSPSAAPRRRDRARRGGQDHRAGLGAPPRCGGRGPAAQ